MKGGKRMNKFTAPSVGIAILISMLMIPFVNATPSESVSGYWFYLPSSVVITKTSGDNIFKSGDEDGVWSGSFVGTSEDHFEVIVHPMGFVTCQGRINFEGMVKGESGSMVILFVGKKDLGTGLWSGKWVILGGTDGLINLHGKGSWEGPGYQGGLDWGELTYSGKIHFDPS